MQPIVQATGVRKSYYMGEVDVEALRGADFVVHPGEFVAIMGPSGSGKSTLLHILGGLDDSSEGEVSLAGRALAQMDDKELTLLRRRQVGFVFQFFNPAPHAERLRECDPAAPAGGQRWFGDGGES
jgi:putative ABC transport system ATP-binding protein